MKKNFIKGICLIGCIFAFAGCSDDKQASDKDSQNSTKTIEADKSDSDSSIFKNKSDNNNESTEEDSAREATEATVEPTPTAEPAPTAVPEQVWKSAYRQFLENYSDSQANPVFGLIYIDDDEIPELVIIGGQAHFDGADIYTIYNDQVTKVNGDYSYGEYGSFSYAPKENRIFSGYMNHGYTTSNFYSIVDGKNNKIASFSDDLENVGEDMAEYKYNDATVSYEEYKAVNDSLYVNMQTFGYTDCVPVTSENINRQLQ